MRRQAIQQPYNHEARGPPGGLRPATLRKLADYFGVDPAELLQLERTPHNG
jgi:hypothetical protein